MVNFGLWYDFRNPEPWAMPSERFHAQALEQEVEAEVPGPDRNRHQGHDPRQPHHPVHKGVEHLATPFVRYERLARHRPAETVGEEQTVGEDLVSHAEMSREVAISVDSDGPSQERSGNDGGQEDDIGRRGNQVRAPSAHGPEAFLSQASSKASWA